MKAAIFTNEFPPHIYGGAGVHVDYLTRELAKQIEVEVHCFGDQRVKDGNLTVIGHGHADGIELADARFEKAIDAIDRDLRMACNIKGADIVHCHTWYSHFAGLLARNLYAVPMVLTTHSFEPSRPWKEEQLGGAYRVSSWVERTAMVESDGVIAVSEGMKRDACRLFGIDAGKVTVIHNGIDLDEYRPKPSAGALKKYGIDPALPYVLFVGRITRQKGIIHLVRAIEHLRKDAAIVLCAGAPDTPQISAEMRQAVDLAKKKHGKVLWIEQMVEKKDVIELYSHAAVFCCPSVYEPFGIINLEAMACETPVVASAVGGIPEIIVPGETGFLISYDKASEETGEPRDPAKFSRALAEKINELLADEPKRTAFAKAGRRRVEEKFSWKAIAESTISYYERIIRESGKKR
ncbi:MAG: glycogen synthase [Pseudomonadota bacterium]